MTLNKKAVKHFWDNRGKRIKSLSVESISNLEQDDNLLKKKIDLEKKKINSITRDIIDPNTSILDLGGGSGQWACRFAENANNVSLVEFSANMIEVAQEYSSQKNLNNIEFYQCSAEEFLLEKEYDFIWISGLLIYLNDNECKNLIDNCFRMITSSGVLLLRDGTGLERRHEIRDSFSEDLQANYSATYRTSDEYIQLFNEAGFKLNFDEDMFDEGSDLNKWNETRLRLYSFTKK